MEFSPEGTFGHEFVHVKKHFDSSTDDSEPNARKTGDDVQKRLGVQKSHEDEVGDFILKKGFAEFNSTTDLLNKGEEPPIPCY